MRPCPCCKATGNETTTCRRCKADLTPIVRLDEDRTQLLALAHVRLREGNFERAGQLLGRAEALDIDETSRQLRAMLALVQGDFEQAWSIHTGMNQ